MKKQVINYRYTGIIPTTPGEKYGKLWSTYKRVI